MTTKATRRHRKQSNLAIKHARKDKRAKPEKRRSDEAGVSGQWSDDDRDVYDGRPTIAARWWAKG